MAWFHLRHVASGAECFSESLDGHSKGWAATELPRKPTESETMIGGKLALSPAYRDALDKELASDPAELLKRIRVLEAALLAKP